MLQLFIKGGPIMWPLLIASLVAFSVIFERLFFLFKERKIRRPQDVSEMLNAIEKNKIDSAIKIGATSTDFVARTLEYALCHREIAFSVAYQRWAHIELNRIGRSIPILDTIITLAPLLGLLGTVTGMIRSFGLLGASELEAPAAITGGIAEALIATAFGLGIAICALIPFNLLNSKVEKAQQELQDVGSQADLALTKLATNAPTYSVFEQKRAPSLAAAEVLLKGHS
jgi:biopolymer transport protein ExbB